MWRTVAGFFLLGLAAFSAEPRAFAPERWRLGKPISYQNLTIYPVLSDQTWDTKGFLTLDEGIASGKVEVRELGSGQVNRLALVNRSGQPLLLLAGEIIIGGKQDRMVSHDLIVPTSDRPTAVDVFCVERGRWEGRQTHFESLKAMVNPTVRKQAVVDQNQRAVWAQVALASERVAGQPASTSYAEVYRAPAAQSQKSAYEQALRAGFQEKGVVGVLLEINKRPAWADVFADPGLFQKYWPKLLSSYVVEAIGRRGREEPGPALGPQEFLRRVEAGRKVDALDGAYETFENSGGAMRTFQLFSRAPGKEVPVHFTRLAAQ